MEAEAQAALVVFVLYWLLQEIETNSGRIVCPLACSSYSEQSDPVSLTRSSQTCPCAVYFHILLPPLPPLMCECAFLCICICTGAGGSMCPPTRLWWWQLLQNKVGELVWTLLLARFSLSAVYWVNKPEYNVPGSKYLLMIRKRNWVNAILIKQILKASRKLFLDKWSTAVLELLWSQLYSK